MLCLKFIPEHQFPQKRHKMDWFLQLFSYTHKLSMGLWNHIGHVLAICKASLEEIHLAHLPTSLTGSSFQLSLQLFSLLGTLRVLVPCLLTTASLPRSCFREHKVRICLFTPKALAQSIQALPKHCMLHTGNQDDVYCSTLWPTIFSIAFIGL